MGLGLMSKENYIDDLVFELKYMFTGKYGIKTAFHHN